LPSTSQGGVTSAWSKVITFVPKLAAALVTILVGDLFRAFCHPTEGSSPCSLASPT
jgi:hypothetical protein